MLGEGENRKKSLERERELCTNPGGATSTSDDSDDFQRLSRARRGNVSRRRDTIKDSVPRSPCQGPKGPSKRFLAGGVICLPGQRLEFSSSRRQERCFYRMPALGILARSPTGKRKRSCKIQRITGQKVQIPGGPDLRCQARGGQEGFAGV
jgi:hypothetical protein